MPSAWLVSHKSGSISSWLTTSEELQTLDLLLSSGFLPLTIPMDSTQKLIEKLIERRMQNTGESKAVATANVMAAFEKLKKNEN